MTLSAEILYQIAAEKNVSEDQIQDVEVWGNWAEFRINKIIYTVDFTATGKLKRSNGISVKYLTTVSDRQNGIS